MIAVDANRAVAGRRDTHMDMFRHIAFEAITSILIGEKRSAGTIRMTKVAFFRPKFKFRMRDGLAIFAGKNLSCNYMAASYNGPLWCVWFVGWADAIIQGRFAWT